MAVDPSPMAIRFLRCQAELNSVVDRIALIRACLADHDGFLNMVDCGVLSAGYFVPPDNGHQEGEITAVRSLTVDSLVDEMDFVPTHIKIDVEGAEASVLRGACSVLAEESPVLFVELHNAMVSSRGGNPQEAISLLQQSGYELFDSTGNILVAEQIVTNSLLRVVAKKPNSGVQYAL